MLLSFVVDFLFKYMQLFLQALKPIAVQVLILINPYLNSYLFVNKEYITTLVMKCNRGKLADSLYTYSPKYIS